MYYSPTKLDFKQLNFLILSAPVDTIMRQTIKDLKSNNCNLLVRTCEKTYNDEMILQEGIQIIDLEFPDGNSPPKSIIRKWLAIVDNFVKLTVQNPEGSDKKLRTENSQINNDQSIESPSQLQSSTYLNEPQSGKSSRSQLGSRRKSSSKIKNQNKKQRIGIHCLAGLGRAPVLVAIAMIHYGASPEETISLIRKERPGAINHSQAQFIMKYKKKNTNCIIF